ncbi:MAG: bifunctional riboflavin kinase/FAD synthetase [Acidobacteriia bacterium]|nr:bifunctional riboflavin kinase/FAD synthetase [Terriglobia bacterium]
MIARNLEQATGFKPCVLTIGNFDGVHLAHRRLLRAATDAAGNAGLRPAVLMFDPHPSCVVAPERAPRLLTSLEERSELIRGEGIEHILIQPFTAELSRLTPEEFATKFLRDGLGARIVIVGENFRFGCKQAGDTRTLKELGARLGFEVQLLETVRWRGRHVSSGEVRKLVAAGDAGIAARLLERPYAISGDIVHGHGIGSKQTVPTLNLRTDAQVIPARGVYITRTSDLDGARRWNSITNIGYRPTFGSDDVLSIETFLLDPLEGAPPERIRLEFLRRVRDERKFESPEALKAQILRDVGRAKAYFRRLKGRDISL